MLFTRRFRIATKICLVLLVLLLLVVGGLHLLLTGGVDEQLRNRLEAALSRQLQREVQIGTIGSSPFLNYLELREIVVRGPGAGPQAQIERVRLYPDLGRLLRGVLSASAVVIHRPVIDLSEGPGVGGEAPEKDQELLAIPVDQLQIREGEVTVRRGAGAERWRIRGLDVDLWREGAEVRGQARIAEGGLELPEQSLSWSNVEALVVVTKRELVITRLGMDVGNGNVGLSGRVTDPLGQGTLELRLTAGLPLATALPERIRLEGQLTGSVWSPRFQGEARLEGAQWPDLGLVLSADRAGVRGEGLRLLATPGEVSGDFALYWKDFSYQGSVQGRGLELAQLATPLLGPLPLSGVLTFRAVAKGRGLTPAGLTAQAAFRLILLKQSGRSEVAGRADGLVKAENGQMVLEHLRVDLPPNRLTMKGSLGKALDLEVWGKFPRVDLVGELLGTQALGGKGNVEGRLMGPHVAPRFQGSLTWDGVRLLGTDFTTIRGQIELQQRRLTAPGLHVAKGKTIGMIDLRLALPKKAAVLDLEHDLRIEAEGQITGVTRDLLSVFVKGEGPLAGRMTLDASVRGVPARMVGRGHLRLSEATALGEPWQAVEADLVLEPTRLLIEKIRLTRGDEQATGSGFLRFEDGESHFQLASAGLSLDGFRLFRGTGLHGKVRGEVHGEGHGRNPTMRGEFTIADLRYTTVSLGDGQGSFLLQDRRMTTQLTLPKGGYVARGSLQTVHPYAYNVQVTMEQAELAPLFVLTDVSLLEGATGTGSGTAQVAGNVAAQQPSEFTLELEAALMRIQGKTFHARQPVRLEMRDHTLTVAPLAATGDEGWLNAGGQIAYHGDVDIDVKGKIPLAVLLPRPGVMTGVKGHGRLDVKLSGPWKAPRYTGSLSVQGGRLRLGEHPELVEGVGGQIQFQGSEIQVPGITGRWAGGEVRLTGKASRRRSKAWRWVVDLALNTADAKRVFAWERKGQGRVTGRTDFTGKLMADGKRREELRQSLRGKLRLDLEDGKFEQYTVLANIMRILNLTPDPTTGVPYDYLQAVFHLRRGVAETQNLLFVSDTMRVSGLGKIDLDRGEVDMLLGVQPLRTVDKLIRGLRLNKIPLLGHLLFGEEGSALVVSMKVEGPLKEPEVSMVPLESLGRGVLGIFRRVLELPGGLFPAESSRRQEQ